MNRSKLLTLAVIGLLVLNLGTLAFVFLRSPSHEHRPPHGEGPKSIIIERLGFDETQQKDYEIIIHEHRGKTHELQQLSRELHEELFSLLKEKADYKVKTDSLIELISLNQKAVDNLNFDHFQKIKAICKGEQLEKFNALAGDLARLFAPQGHPN